MTQTQEISNIPFRALFESWANKAMNELEERVSLVHFSLQAQRELVQRLVHDFSSRCTPAFAALLHHEKEQGKLFGSSPEERYESFVENYLSTTDSLHQVFHLFPRLEPLILTTYSLWIEQAEELITRLHQDHHLLEEQFSPNSPLGKVTHLFPSLSDPHHGNRSVYKLIFEGGVEIIYKPRSLGLDVAYNQFIEKLSLPNGLKSYQVIDRGNYGWVEFISHLPCQTDEEVRRYFDRLGQLICLIFLFEGSDCHYENLIGSGEHPYFIDVESLFHPTVKQPPSRPNLSAWNQSVFRTGFLPTGGQPGLKNLDISPLTVAESYTIQQPEWVNLHTDMLQLAWQTQTVQIPVPRPKYQGKTVSTAPYIPELLSGFANMYRYFKEHSKEILDWLEDFWHHPVRCIFRPTVLYGQIVQRLNEPQLMSSQEEMEKLFKALTQFSSLRGTDTLNQIVAIEKKALIQGDIPLFLCYPGNTHLYCGTQLIASDLFENPPRDTVRNRIERLSEADLALQLDFIEQSLYFLKKPKNRQPDPPQELQLQPLTDELLLQYAEEIGEKILSTSLPLNDGTPTWLTLEQDPHFRRLVFQPISPHFYSGLCGIAFFLDHLGKIRQKPHFCQIASQLIERITKPYTHEKEAMKLLLTIGGFTGIGGLIYGLASLGKIEEALHLTTLIEKRKIEEDRTFDIVSGSAGLILSLLSLYKQTQKGFVLDLAKRAGQHLLKQAKSTPQGLAWETLNGQCLCGFSHGASGIAYALLKLYEITKDPAYLAAAQQGYEYEKGLYSAEHQNWPDLRKTNDYAICSWCHGAPGIALARLYSSSTFRSEEETQQALAATLAHLEGAIDHLCCGTTGRIAILLAASKKLHEPKWKEIAHKQTARLIDRYRKKGYWQLFPDLSSQSPGLMQGLAGIGYLLLRLTQQGEHLPEILILE